MNVHAIMDINREIYFMEDRFIEDEIESAIKKLLIKKYLFYKEIIDNGIQPMPRNMIMKTKLFESNL